LASEGEVPRLDDFRSDDDLSETIRRRAAEDIARQREIEHEATLLLLSGKITSEKFVDAVMPPGTPDREALDRAMETSVKLAKAIETGHPSTLSMSLEIGNVSEGVDEPPLGE
jgi:hypothetical protein